MYKVVKRYFDRGIYSKEDVKTFVVAGKLTKEQYKEITGEAYPAEQVFLGEGSRLI